MVKRFSKTRYVNVLRYVLLVPDSVFEAVTCGSNFHVINKAYTKYSAGYAVTGVGGVDCAHHGFKQPVGVVDLQKGERYAFSVYFYNLCS